MTFQMAAVNGTGGGRVLVVDDVAANRELLSQDLEDEGFEVTAVASGAACLAAARAHPPEVILLDIQMAGMDGIETCRQLKADAVTQHIPVLFVTAARADDATVLAALRAGGNDFLTKPYSPPILVARVTCQIAISRAYALLSRQAMTDELTGVYSRRYVFESMRRILKLASRSSGCIACLMADVDHFKAINDTHGHLEGDRILRTVASTISENVRETDLVGRYGGEEFIILLPHTGLAGAITAGEKIRAAIMSQCAPVTISIGVTAHCVLGVDTMIDDAAMETLVNGLVRDADRGVYAAKAQGRNRVVSVATTPPFELP